jgi:hypothetical protein
VVQTKSLFWNAQWQPCGQEEQDRRSFVQGLTVEYLSCNEGAEDLCAQDCKLRRDNEIVLRNAVVTCLRSFCFRQQLQKTADLPGDLPLLEEEEEQPPQEASEIDNDPV